MRKRTRGRETALRLLYWQGITCELPEKVVESYFSEYPEDEEVTEFATALFYGVIKEQVELDKVIKDHLEHWKIERLAMLDHHILRLGLFELLFLCETPPVVVIDEAIELTKRFSTQDSFRFVNGILDKAIKGKMVCNRLSLFIKTSVKMEQ
ncbi:MAG: transcription antitermination factor NusB [bacterium]|nr:transcription antitermination factor NusB [bacterium]